MKNFLVLTFLIFALSSPAVAEKLKYYQDPVFQGLNAGDSHPMSDLLALAEQGDVRAQFILGDLYAKGKGGLSKNEKKGAYWFEQSARNGYYPSFIRLAALAKRRDAPEEAFKWYTLAAEYFRGGADQKHAVKARADLAAAIPLTKEQQRAAKDAAAKWKADRIREMRERETTEKIEKAKVTHKTEKEDQEKRMKAAKEKRDQEKQEAKERSSSRRGSYNNE